MASKDKFEWGFLSNRLRDTLIFELGLIFAEEAIKKHDEQNKPNAPRETGNNLRSPVQSDSSTKKRRKPRASICT